MRPDDAARILEGVPILVVEDHPASGRMLTAVLAAAGAHVDVVATAEAALAHARSTRPRVMIMDLLLPDGSGLLVVEKLMSDPVTRSIVCIAVTVLNGEALERDARAAGCAALVRKPIDTDSFATLVAQHLGEAR